jgi:predicted metalloprotease
MRWQGRRESNNIEDRRDESGGPVIRGPGFRLPGGKGGIILLVVVIFASYYGVDLTGLITGEPVTTVLSSAPSARRKMKRRNSPALSSRRPKIPGGNFSKRWGAIISNPNW